MSKPAKGREVFGKTVRTAESQAALEAKRETAKQKAFAEQEEKTRLAREKRQANEARREADQAELAAQQALHAIVTNASINQMPIQHPPAPPSRTTSTSADLCRRC